MNFWKRSVMLCIILVTLLISGSGSITYAESPLVDPTDVTPTATEILAYDLNRAVTTKDSGFPRDQPPRSGANGDWTAPVNFAQGTLYYRLEIRSQPQPQTMILQFCVWQYNLTLENCGQKQRLTGTSNTVLTWSQPVQRMWKKNGVSIDWKNPRQRYGIAIKNSQGLPVSGIKKFNWGGEDPSKWYPLDMRFTVVAVAQGATFSGWGNYGGSASEATELAVSAAGTASSSLFAQSDAEFAADLSWDGSLLDQVADEELLVERAFIPLVAR